MMLKTLVRTRYAPSPTGSLHLGGLRTALYNYLFAKHNHGKFLLRIEDTDQSREVDNSINDLHRILSRLSLLPDEGPFNNGPYAPYIQSQRLDLYRKYAWELVHNKHAYVCFCDTNRLKVLRQRQASHGMPTLYDGKCSNLSDHEVTKRRAENQLHVIRLRIPKIGHTRIYDEIRGVINVENKTIDDQIILKSDGFPTYHLAAVIDDHYMKISHVIRGEEWLGSTAKHFFIYKSLNWNVPKFYHLPLLVNKEKQKLSKRMGHMSVESLLKEGYLPSALINFVVHLGWHAQHTQREIYSLEELIKVFTLDRVQKSSAYVNMEKLRWINEQHIRKLAEDNMDELVRIVQPLFEENFRNNHENMIKSLSDLEYLKQVLYAAKDKVTLLTDFLNYCHYFYERPNWSNIDVESRRKCWHEIETPKILAKVQHKFMNSNDNEFDVKSIQHVLHETMKDENINAKSLMGPIRYALTGQLVGTSLAKIIHILGLNETIHRIETAVLNNDRP